MKYGYTRISTIEPRASALPYRDGKFTWDCISVADGTDESIASYSFLEMGPLPVASSSIT
jgi:hypothetical protein